MEKYLAKRWNEVEPILREKGLVFSYVITTAPNAKVAETGYRIVRVRKTAKGWEFVLTGEKVETEGKQAPLD